MSHPLSRRTVGDSLDRASGRSVSPRLERAIRGEVDLVQGRAVVQAARTQAVEYVAHSALRAVEGLTEMETQALQRAPLGDARYKAIVDTATGALARIVAETGQG
jgi:O-acetyl-ADP-ribose deacetylase (regulator of RNase III)